MRWISNSGGVRASGASSNKKNKNLSRTKILEWFYWNDFFLYSKLDDPENQIFSKSEIGKCHPKAFFFLKNILSETWYETYDGELLAIIEIFKTYCHYIADYMYKVFVFTNYNNLC